MNLARVSHTTVSVAQDSATAAAPTTPSRKEVTKNPA